MLHINTVHVQRETLWVKQLAGEQYKMICSAWTCKHTYIAESFVELCTHSSVWKVSSVHRGECFYRWFVQAHSPVCSALWIAQKSSQFFLWCSKVGGVFGEGGERWSMFQEVGVCMGQTPDVWASQVLPHQTHPTMSLWTLICALWHNHTGVETCSHKVGSKALSWYAEALSFPFTGSSFCSQVLRCL